MAHSNAYADGIRRVNFHLAEDAITNWLKDKPSTAAYIDAVAKKIEETDGRDPQADRILEEAEGVASAIIDAILRETGDQFRGDSRGPYGALCSAARDRLGIDW